MGRTQLGGASDAEIAVTHIIGEDDDNVGGTAVAEGEPRGQEHQKRERDERGRRKFRAGRLDLIHDGRGHQRFKRTDLRQRRAGNLRRVRRATGGGEPNHHKRESPWVKAKRTDLSRN